MLPTLLIGRGYAATVTWSPARFASSWRTGTATTCRTRRTVIGRAKGSGASLSGGTEFSTPEFTANAGTGLPAIPAHAHSRLASFEHNGGTRILRRGYSFTDGIEPQAGTLLGGLFFIAFVTTSSPDSWGI